MAKQDSQTPANDDPAPTFEASLAKLERSVRQLEEGKLGLSESLQCYEEGVKQLKQCYRDLESAERKIELLAGVDAEGKPVTEPFDEREMTLDEKAASRSKRRSRPANRALSADEESEPLGGLF
ncbi:MAG: exodeoxyribonuclease VII small subunit [Candidatus Anammoximicrobium sp.]|nr:exodeoxyribonuclease VII small subunit [Candidatus Anammoximicrobium sp.]